MFSFRSAEKKRPASRGLEFLFPAHFTTPFVSRISNLLPPQPPFIISRERVIKLIKKLLFRAGYGRSLVWIFIAPNRKTAQKTNISFPVFLCIYSRRLRRRNMSRGWISSTSSRFVFAKLAVNVVAFWRVMLQFFASIANNDTWKLYHYVLSCVQYVRFLLL